MTLAGLFDLFKGLFSRTFWFGAFLPLAIFAAANLAMTALVFPGTVQREEWTKIGGDAPLTNLTITFIGLVVLAYAVSPLIPLCRGVLDGALLPDWLHNWLRDERAAEARGLRAARRTARDRYNDFDLMLSDRPDSVFNRLRRAHQEGQRIYGPPHPATVAATVASFAASLAGLEQVLAQGRALDATAVRAAADRLEAALKTAPASRGDALDTAQRGFIDLLGDARQDAQHRWLTLVARSRGLALNNPQATRIGDARGVVESYSLEVYGADFDYLWPRLQLVIPAASQLNERIATAQGQVDFAALSLVLTLLFAAIWLPLLGWQGASVWPVLALGAVAPPVVFFWYRLLFESQGAFGEVVKLVIDQHRLDLLTTVLRQPLPATLMAEKQIWGRLCRAEQPGTAEDITYRHPAPGAAA